MLDRTLADVRKRIAKRPKLNENDTKATLIEPILQALGWDVHDVDEVAREHKAPRAKPVDYALLVMREPRLYVEAKALGENLDDGRVANQIMGYAAVAGVEWIVLTNGDEWRIYNSHAVVPIDQKLLRTVRVSDTAAGAEAILGLLSKEQLKTKKIDALWRAHFVDSRVKSALERFFNPDKDMSLVNHVLAVTKDLTPEDIRGSMRRCKLTLDFPLSPSDVTERPRRSKAAKTKPGKGPTPDWKKELGFEITIKHLIDSKLMVPPMKFFVTYKGTQLDAVVMANGTVKCVGQEFTSLSQAASAARASIIGKRADGSYPPTNGWAFWRYKNSDGKPVHADMLRQQFLKLHKGASAEGA